MKTLLAIISLVSGLSAYAQEESATTKAKQSDIKVEAKKEDLDAEITNAKMRADSGSKSKHSVSMTLNYSGGTTDSPFAYRRPNIVGANATPTLTTLAGDVSYRYRLSANDSLTAGVGLTWITPGFDLEARHKNAGIKKQEASNPSISYGRAFKVGKVQNIFSGGVTKYTSAEATEGEKTNIDIGIGHTALMEVGTSGLQLGLAADVGYFNYSQYLPGENAKTGEQDSSTQVEYVVGVYPFVEYAFNDKYNFRTVYRGNSYASNRDNRFSFSQREPTQSAGIGIAATRDIFLYPNVQWVWRDTRSEKTNVALSASMNFF